MLYPTPKDYHKSINASADSHVGYMRFYDPQHPLAEKQGRVWLHRHVASVKIGRWILPDEQVHHIDENRINNDPSNIEVLSARDHAHRHHPPVPDRECQICGSLFTPDKQKSKYCSPACSSKASEKNTLEEVHEAYLKAGSFSGAGRLLGISDVAVKKRLKKAGIL